METIHLMDSDTIPEDAACLVINGPATDFSEDDLKKVTDYLDQGGKVVAITTLTEGPLPNYDKLFAYMHEFVDKSAGEQMTLLDYI